MCVCIYNGKIVRNIALDSEENSKLCEIIYKNLNIMLILKVLRKILNVFRTSPPDPEIYLNFKIHIAIIAIIQQKL